MDEASIPKIISVDDHVVAPAHVWERWLPAKYRDRGQESSAEAWRASRSSAATPSTCSSSRASTSGPRLLRGGRRVPRRGQDVAGREHAERTQAPRGPGHPRLRPGVATPAVRRGLGRHLVAGRVRWPGPCPHPAAHLVRGVRPHRHAGNRCALRGAVARRADAHRPRRPRSSGRSTSRRSSVATSCGARASPSPRPARIWRRCVRGRSSTVTSWSSPGRRSGPASPMLPTTRSCSSAPTPRCPSTRASPGSSATCAAPASTSVPSRRWRAAPTSARSSTTRCASHSRTSSV